MIPKLLIASSLIAVDIAEDLGRVRERCNCRMPVHTVNSDLALVGGVLWNHVLEQHGLYVMVGL